MPQIKTGSGNVFYTRRGSAGSAVVCLHGAGGNHRHWGYIQGGLTDTARVFAVDLPGHGRSDGPGHSRIADYAAWVPLLLDSLELEQVILLGHSMGAATALQVALDAPERVQGLVLLGASARLRVAPTILEGLQDDLPAAIESLVRLLFPIEADERLHNNAITDFHQVAPHVLRNDFAACDGWDIRPRLAEVACPLLIIAGTDDQLTPLKLAYELHSGVAGSELLSLSGVGHMAMLERPGSVCDAVRPWLAGQQ
jgi:pimeloyl-ACP methyl ester carboxylesterase